MIQGKPRSSPPDAPEAPYPREPATTDPALWRRRIRHDIRHELGTIIMLAEAVTVSDDIGPQSKQRIEQLLGETRWLGHLLNRLDEDDGQPAVPTPERIRVDELAGEMVTSLRLATRLRLGFVAEPAWAHMDPLALWRALRNVLDNACRVARRNVKVQVSSERGWIAIQVDDDGPGFGSAPGGLASLGLGIVHDLVSEYGGSLEIRHREVGGASVRILLPRGGAAVRVLVCDDHAVFADSLALVIADAGHTVVGVTYSPDHALPLLRSTRPDVCLIDLRFPEGTALERMAELHAAAPHTRFIVLSGFIGPDVLDAGLAAGVRGFAHKGQRAVEILALLRRVHAGETVIDRAGGALARMHSTAQQAARFLTPREREVLSRLARGETTAALAREMGVTRSTARSHVQSVLTKLGVHSQREAVITAARDGLVSVRTGEWLL